MRDVPREATLDLIYKHYEDTCAGLEKARTRRDHAFYATLAVLGLMLFDAYSPADFTTLLAAALRKNLGATTLPNLDFLRTILWFLLLGILTKYCQAVVTIERLYRHVHTVEKALADQTGATTVFRREGKGYLDDYPWFLSWAHHLYQTIFPLIVAATVTLRVAKELLILRPHRLLAYVDGTIALAIGATVALFLVALHAKKRKLRLSAPDAGSHPTNGQAD